MELAQIIYKTGFVQIVNSIASKDKINVDIFDWGYGYSYESWHGFWKPKEDREDARLLVRYRGIPSTYTGLVMAIIGQHNYSAPGRGSPDSLIKILDKELLHLPRRW